MVSLSGSASGPQNVPVKTSSGLNVIVPRNEAQRLARIGKVEDNASIDSTKDATAQAVGAMQLQEGLPQANPIPKTSEAFPPGQLGLSVPGLGKNSPGAFAAKSVLEGKAGNVEGIVEVTRRMKDAGLTPEQIFPDDPIQQGLLKLNLNEQDLKVLKSGEADVSRLTQAVETIPIIKGLAGAARFLGTTSGRVQQINDELSTAETNMKDWSANAVTSPQFQEDYLKLINQTEDRVLWLESKLKLIALQSPDIQAEPEKLDAINQKILGLKISARNAKFKAQGIIA